MSSVNTQVDDNIYNDIFNILGKNCLEESLVSILTYFDILCDKHNIEKGSHDWHKYRNLFICELNYEINNYLKSS